MGGTRGSGIVSSSFDVIGLTCGVWDNRSWWSVCNLYVFGLGGVRGEMGEWMRGLDLGFTNPVGTVGVLDVCLCLG